MPNRGYDRLTPAGLAVICLLIAVGILTDTALPLAAGASFLLLALMTMACPPGMAAMLFAVQIVFTTSFLGGLGVYTGPFRLAPDDVLQIWIFILWTGALIDGDGRIPSSGAGKLILLLAGLSLAAFVRGVLRGYDTETAALFLKPMLGYLFFFPSMWLLKKAKNLKLLTVTIAAASVTAALWVILKGYTGGEGVYVRLTSGLRVSSRELNAVMIGLFLTGFALWKKHASIPVIPAGLALVAMGASLLLGQSRALWLAVAAGALAAFVADLGRSGREGLRLGPLVSRILLIVVFTAGSIAFVYAAGLLTPGDVAARGGGADGGLAGDVSLWARFLSWWEITRTVTASPVTLMFGTGFGHEITYFRPDLFSVVSIPYVDGSFFQLLLNTGVAGALLLALLYARGIAGSFRLVLKTGSMYGMWLTASFTALTIAALSSSLITNYRFTCIWGFLFAVMETLRSRTGENG